MFTYIKQLEKKTKGIIILAFITGFIIAWCMSMCMMRSHHREYRFEHRGGKHDSHKRGYTSFEKEKNYPNMPMHPQGMQLQQNDNTNTPLENPSAETSAPQS